MGCEGATDFVRLVITRLESVVVKLNQRLRSTICGAAHETKSVHRVWGDRDELLEGD